MRPHSELENASEESPLFVKHYERTDGAFCSLAGNTKDVKI